MSTPTRTPKGVFKRTRKRRRDRPRPLPTALGGIGVIIVILGFIYLATQLYNGVPGANYTTVYASVPQVGNLLTHDPVKVAGVDVGQVASVGIGHDGRPRIKLQINPGTKLTKGTKVTFRANGLLGARYVQLKPAPGGAPLPDGATIRGGVKSYTYGVPETLGTFDPRTRAALGEMVGGLGQGLLGRGMGLNDTIHIGATYARPFSQTAQTILARHGAAARLVPALAAAVRPLDANRRDLADLNGVAADAITPFVTRRAAVRSTLTKAPGTLHAVVPGLSRGTRLLSSVRNVAVQANRTLPGVPTGLRDLSALLNEREPLHRAERLLRAVRPAVPGVLRISSSLRPVLQPLTRTLQHADPILDTVDRYECDIRNFGVSMRSMTGFTQPGPDHGPAGPAQAFRLQIAAPLSTNLVGVKDYLRHYTRRGVTAPCTFLSTTYRQFLGGGGG